MFPFLPSLSTSCWLTIMKKREQIRSLSLFIYLLLLLSSFFYFIFNSLFLFPTLFFWRLLFFALQLFFFCCWHRKNFPINFSYNFFASKKLEKTTKKWGHFCFSIIKKIRMNNKNNCKLLFGMFTSFLICIFCLH